jgi:hypothetical protein
LACLVPAFDAGVVRGLGHVPSPAPLRPAWTDQDSVTLPVYFHWEFGTGPAGDFESLVRRLQPFIVESGDGAPTVGTVKMHIGAAGGPVDLPAGHPKRVLEMDGALRALQQEDGRIAEIPGDFQQALGDLLDSIADSSGSDPDDGAVGPPLYGAWPANRFSVADDAGGWFGEVNLDPRARVAAGLGAEVVRREQEDLMSACWEQVGAVIKANALLSRSRLSIEASTSFHARTLEQLSPEGALALAEPLADRTPMAGVTVKAAMAPTSLPDATVDPAMRRLLAPTNRFVRKSARRANVDASLVGSRFVAKLAAGTDAVDPTSFVPAGVAPPKGKNPRTVRGRIDLTPLGLPVTRTKAEAASLISGMATFREHPAPPAHARLVLRSDLRRTGLITTRHVTAIRTLPANATRGSLSEPDPIISLRNAASMQPEASGFLFGLGAASGHLEWRAVDITSRGTIEVRTDPANPNLVIGRVGGGTTSIWTLPGGITLTGEMLQPGQPSVVLRRGATRGEVAIEMDGDRVIMPPRTRPLERRSPDVDFTGPTVTLPPLRTEAVVIANFEQAVGRLAEVSSLSQAPAPQHLVAFGLTGAAKALALRCSPAVAHTIRTGTMVRFGDVSLGEMLGGSTIDGLTVAPLFDRIMAYPRLNDPFYRMLARYDRNRLLPGVDEIPPDSVTLLETNPRFIAAFLAGVNHELNRELLWRRFPTDQRGTPARRFWDLAGGANDIPPVHRWKPLTRTLANVAGGESNLVLLVRGELLRRYPNTVVVAIAATSPTTPSTNDEDTKRPIFSGFIEPDISFFGFDLEDDDIRDGNGWFFALQEQVTEPRFGLDQVVGRSPAELKEWREAAWPDTPIQPGATFDAATLASFATDHQLNPAPANGATVADALFQNPIQVIVHGRHLAIEGSG